MLMITTFIAWAVIDARRVATGSGSSSRWLSGPGARRGGRARGDPAGRGRAAAERDDRRRSGCSCCCRRVAGMIWGGNPKSFPPAFSIKGYNDRRPHGAVLAVRPVHRAGRRARCWSRSSLLFRRTDARPADARGGVRAGGRAAARRARRADVHARLGAGLAGRRRWPACSSRPPSSSRPTTFDAVLVFGFTAAVLGGLESPPGALVGGVLLGLALSYVSGYAGASMVTLGALAILVAVLMVRPQRPVRPAEAARVRAPAARHARSRWPRSTLLRHLAIAVVAGVALFLLTERARPVRQPAAGDDGLLLRRRRGADGADRAQRADLARARRADGGRRLHDGEAAGRGRHRAAAGGRARRSRRSSTRGRRRARRARPRRGCAGPTWPARRSRSRSGCRRSRSASRTSSARRTGSPSRRRSRRPRSATTFPLERWQAWIACLRRAARLRAAGQPGAQPASGASFRAVRDDEVAAELAGLHVARMQVARVRGQRGVRRAWPAGCSWSSPSSRRPGAFPLALSVALLTGVDPRRARQPARARSGARPRSC